jgi:hypothetical protein
LAFSVIALNGLAMKPLAPAFFATFTLDDPPLVGHGSRFE